jgi:hypothetical protein
MSAKGKGISWLAGDKRLHLVLDVWTEKSPKGSDELISVTFKEYERYRYTTPWLGGS